ncbi:NADPH-dependent oxidoreductase [Streptococcus danieliae]|uniref:NADPH-dependent oxidoreductase n=1 Tax=Streptococcus danieliae TaxID=747656 RepID=UPI0026F14729|nr:NADPH-dependent oxidoreductase [Streptococcus danieliae]
MNETIQTQLNHRSIRKFQKQELTKEEVELLVEVAQQAPTSNFRQSYSILRITDPELKQELAKIGQQEYIASAPHLFVFLVDQARNTKLAKEQGAPALVQGSPERFLAAFSDALIAAQNMVVAAESMGLGTVYLGSILNDPKRLCQLLALPDYVYPAVGLALGWPDQDPEKKPRLPKEIVHMENVYQELENPVAALKEYDQAIEEYYDLRSSNNRLEAFTTKISKEMATSPAKRAETLAALQEQGFFVDPRPE